MIALLLDLHSHQTSCVPASAEFAISRGVQLDDVLTLIIFNATLEFVFQSWKIRLNHHGWMIARLHEERLLNARYVYDMILFANISSRVWSCDTSIAIWANSFWLRNARVKHKHLNDTGLEFVTIESLLIEAVLVDKAHRYLLRMLSTSLERGKIEFQYR